MKKIIFTILLMFVIVGCSGNYNKLSCNKLITKLENKDTFILFVGNNTTNSKSLKNTLNTVLKQNNLEAYEINSTSISQDEKNTLRKYFSYEDISIIFFKDGIDPSKLSHITNTNITLDELRNHLTNLGFIESENNDSDNEKTSN